MPALVAAADLSDYPGAPFTEGVAESAGDSVRDQAGWHIAPEITETMVVRSRGGRDLLLRSLRVTAVTEITHNGTAVTDWDDDAELFREGILHRENGWPIGVLRVTLTHGYLSIPPALLPVVATWAQAIKRGGQVTQESLGSRSVSFATGESATVSDALARYTIKPGP